MSSLRGWTVSGLLVLALGLAAASGVASSNGDLSGCYAREAAGGLDSYWFDGGDRVVASFWTGVSGSTYYEGTYEVSAGSLHIEYDDGSTEDFSLQVYDDGIQLDDLWFEYTGEECS